MPLRAKIKNRIISVFDYSDKELRQLQTKIRNNQVAATCIECDLPFQVRCIDTDDRLTHFFHVTGAHQSCATKNPDYVTHELFKEALKAYLKKSPYFNIARMEEEVTELVGSAKTRRIDVKATAPDGSVTAHEVQLSYQSVSQIQERTSDYANIGIKSVWWLGENFPPSFTRNLEEAGIDWGIITRSGSDKYAPVHFEYRESVLQRQREAEKLAEAEKERRAMAKAKRVDSFVMPTEYGGQAIVVRHDAEYDLYQSKERAWWRLVDGVLIETKRQSSLSGIYDQARAAYLSLRKTK